MDYSAIRFPLEANVQSLAHFTDPQGNYIFTFGSPFCYTAPEDLKAKEAFLIASFNHLKKKSLSAESVFTYYINSKEKRNHPDPHTKASIREAKIYHSDGTLLGRIDVLLQRGIFRSYAGLHANPVYDTNGKLIAFCHFNPENHSKDIYTCDPDFDLLNEPLTDVKINELLSAAKIRRVFSYDIVESEEADSKDRFMAIFSASKKSELSNNRLRYFGSSADEDTQDLLMTALFAFFWGTYVDIPLS